MIYMPYNAHITHMHKQTRNKMIETIDMITLTDIFPVSKKEDYVKLKFVEGSGSLSYYIFNMNVNKIENKKNGLVTM
jgi:hypothetical protein